MIFYLQLFLTFCFAEEFHVSGIAGRRNFVHRLGAPEGRYLMVPQ